MDNNIKAIETVYSNHRFRSRLEARYAVFFNALGIKWEYEREGFNLDGLNYLPDFWLPDHKYWIEIKGNEPTETDLDKCLRLTDAVDEDTRVFMFGPIPHEGSTPCSIFYKTQPFLDAEVEGINFDRIGKDFEWIECPFCGKVGIIFQADVCKLCSCVEENFKFMTAYKKLEDKIEFDTLEFFVEKIYQFRFWNNSPRIKKAFDVARSARFEFGEKGR